MEKCFLCPNLCGVDRVEKKGLCMSGADVRLPYYGVHFFEEPPISGTRGSGTVFFSGCTMRCDYCQNRDISRVSNGKLYSPRELSEVFRELENLGVHNVNLVTPTHFSNRIREALDIYRPKIPIVYNTSGYERVEILKEMEDYVDVYLTDFKYGFPEIGVKLSKRGDYTDVALNATREMIRQKRIEYGEDGMLKKGVIVRHLVLPGYVENSLKVVEIFAENFKNNAILSLMSQFTPMAGSQIDRRLKPLEYKIVCNKAISLDIDDCFVQDTDSVGTEFIPKFQI